MNWFLNVILDNVRHKNAVLNIILKLLSSLIFLFVVPFVISSAGEAKYGIFAMFLTLHGYVSLVDVGFSYAVGLRYTRSISSSQKKAQAIIKSVFPLYSGLSLLPLLSLALFPNTFSDLFFGNQTFLFEVRIFGVGLSFMILSALFSVILQAHESFVAIGISRLFLDITKAVGLSLCAVFDFSLLFFTLFLVGGSLFKLLLEIWFGRHHFPSFSFCVKWKVMRAYFWLALPSIGIAILSLVMSMTDKIFVSRLLGPEAFSRYSFSFDLTTKVYFVIYGVLAALYPAFIKEIHNYKAIKNLLKSSFIVVTIMACFFYIPIFIYSTQVLSFLVSADFAIQASQILKVFALSSIAYIFFAVMESFVNASGNSLKVLSVYLVGVLTLFTHIHFGQKSALDFAFASLSMLLVMLFMISIFFYKILQRLKF